MRVKSALPVLALLALLVQGGAARAQGNENYVRLERGAGGKAALQCAVAHFRSENPAYKDVEIILYGVVHIADQDYYARVQRDLDSYDVVLYEGVAPGSEAPSEADKSLGELQQVMGEMLGLTFQKDGIDYTRGNLVHADMNMDQLKEALGGGSISPFGNLLDEEQMKAMVPMIRMIAGFGKTLMDSNPRMRDQLKMQMAGQLSQADLSQGLGEKATQAILIDRNKVVMEVLAHQLQQQPSGEIAIFYGAAHMPDFEERLAALGFQRTSMRWMSAWQISGGVPDDAHQAGDPVPAARERRQPSVWQGARPAQPEPAAPAGPRWF